MKFVSIDYAKVSGRRCLMRVDLNVPIDGSGKITDDTRIQEIIPDIISLQKNGARIILVTHLGRPKGRHDKSLSVIPVAKKLSELIGHEIIVSNDLVGDNVIAKTKKLKDGNIMMLENIRFHKGEESNDISFARSLAKLCDVYIGNSFSNAHRSHASVDALPKLMKPNKTDNINDALKTNLTLCAGRKFIHEYNSLSDLFHSQAKTIGALIGGAKISTKLGVLENLIEKVNVLAIGGAMANTFLLADGINIGESLVEKNMIQEAKKIIDKCRAANCNLLLPVDVTLFGRSHTGAATRIAELSDACMPADKILDTGPATTEMFAKHLSTCEMVIWNGPLGAFETKPFDKSTKEIAKKISNYTLGGGVSIIGGGDTLSAISDLDVKFSYKSTAGGAFLEYLAGNELPGIKALEL